LHLIEAILKTKPSLYWIKKLTEHGVPNSVIRKISDVIKDEQTKSLKMINSIAHPEIGSLSLPRLPLTLSKSPVEITGRRYTINLKGERL
jgi:crotonobetainyl-CoA:carnitine CoA-transferase CaiB-like acyl-CoA transferase